MIPAFDLRTQYASIRDEIAPALQEVLDSGQFILGSQVRALEQEMAAYCGCRFGIGVASGTDALQLALATLGIGPGDEVITTAFTFVATASTISRSGARPVFADIDPQTYNIDPNRIEAAITSRTRAIIPVHLYGHPAAMDTIMRLARMRGLSVIEDCAQAVGAEINGLRVGSYGELGCFSFFPTKNLGAYGDACASTQLYWHLQDAPGVGEDLASGSIDLANAPERGYVTLEFAPLAGSAEAGDYYFYVENPDAAPGQGVRVAYSVREYTHSRIVGQRYENGQPAEGDLTFMTYCTLYTRTARSTGRSSGPFHR